MKNKKNLVVLVLAVVCLLLGVFVIYKYNTSRLTIHTHVSYAVDTEEGKTLDFKDITDTLDEEKVNLEYAMKDKKVIDEYGTITANLLPKIFNTDTFNNETVTYYVNFNEKEFNKETCTKLKYKTDKGTLDMSEDVTEFLKEHFVKFVFSNSTIDINYYVVVNYNKLHTYIENNNNCAVKKKNAKVVTDKNAFIIQNEVIGTYLDIEEVIKDIQDGNFPIDFNTYYQVPKIVSEDLVDICNTMNEFVNWSVTYTDDTKIQADVNAVILNKNNEIVLNYDFLAEGVKEIAKKYNTVGKQRNFKTHDGKKIKVGGTPLSTWGNVVDTEKELEELKNLFESKTTVEERVPKYLREKDKIGKTYIEVSIDKQHIWVYENGKVILESGVVTGTKGKHDTPKGLYYISECIPGKYLVGDGYKTWVNKWMRLTNTGIGLHDATWRSAFGGSIYSYSGSHGCVNLPSGFADTLFKKAYTGMPVVIY